MELIRRKAVQLAEKILANEPMLRIVLFGSHAAGTADERSDFDIGVDARHPLSAEKVVGLREAFDELPILQSVDVVDFWCVDAEFRAIAEKDEVVLYERNAV